MGIYLVMRNNLIRIFRHKILLIMTFLLPLLICFVIGFIDFDRVSLRIGFLTGQKSNAGKMIDVLRKTEGITYAFAQENTVNTDLMTGKFQVIIDCRVDKAEKPEVIAYKPEKDISCIKSAVLFALEQGSPLQLEGLKHSGPTFTERSSGIFLSLFLMFSVVYASALIRDKQNGTLLRYQFANQGRFGYLAGFLVVIFFITFLQVIFGMAALTLLQKRFCLGVGEGFCIAGVIALLSSVYSVIICNYISSEVKANVTASALCVLMTLLGGTFIAVDEMPALIKALSFGSPVRWVVELLRIL